MDSIVNKQCSKCTQGCEKREICVMQDPDNRPLMIVRDRPSTYNSNNGLNLLELMIDKVVRIPKDLIYQTFAFKCDLEGKVDVRDYFTCVDTYFEQEVMRVKPKAILVLGEDAMNAVLGITGITKNRGRDVEVVFGDHRTKVIPTFSTGYIERVEAHMKTFAEDLQKAYHIAIDFEAGVPGNYTVCKSIAEVNTLMDYCEETGIAAFDFESTGLDYFMPGYELTCLSISFQHGSSWIIPLKHREPVFDGKKVVSFNPSVFNEDDYLQIIEILKSRFFGNVRIRKVGHNIKFDLHCCRTVGITEFLGRFDDTMLMHHVIDGRLRHGLKEVLDRYFPGFSGYEDEVKKYNWNAVPAKILFPYSGADTDGTLRLCTQLETELLKDERSYVLYRNHSIPVCFALERAEWNGMLIDKTFTLDSIKEVESIINDQITKLKSFKAVKRFEEYQRDSAVKEKLSDLKTKLAEAEMKANTTAESKRSAKIEALTEKLAKAVEKYPDGHKTVDKLRNDLEVLKSSVDSPAESKTIQKLKADITAIKTGELSVYEGVNFSSPTQMAELIYGEHGFKIKKKIDRKSRREVDGTGKEVLEDLKDDTGFLKELLILRSLEKMLGTYIQGIWDRVDPNNYVHTDLKQIGTYTGRLSSANPNLQNIPNMGKLKDELSKAVVGKVKKMFGVPEGHTLLACDFSQAELRIVAEYANETNMLSAYANGVDLHKKTGCAVAGITLEEFDKLPKDEAKKVRGDAKPVNFGYLYGQSAEGFMDFAKGSYGIYFTLEQAQQMRKAYFDEYPKLLEYHEIYKAKAKKFGYVRTFFGRRIFLNDVYSQDQFLRGAAERQAINSPIQGSAGEWTLFCIALLRFRLDHRVIFVNTVHDSILFYCPDELVDASMRIIKDTCENPPTLEYFGKKLEKVAMQLDCEVSKKSWKELEPFTVN